MAKVHSEASIAQSNTDASLVLALSCKPVRHFCKGRDKSRRLRVCGAALIVHESRRLRRRRAPRTFDNSKSRSARPIAPTGPNAAVRVIDRLEDWGFFAGAPRGPYPWFGSVYPGGGFAGGAGFRKPFADDGAFNVFGGYSINMFARAQADLELPTFARNHARITLSGRYIDAPDVRYFGVGNSSDQDDATRFGYRPTTASARLEIGGQARIDRWRRQPSFSRDLRRPNSALYRTAVLATGHAWLRRIEVHVHQQHRSCRHRLAASAWLLGARRAVSRAVRRLPGAER